MQSNSIIAIRFTAIPVWILTKENKHNDISKSHFFDRSLTKLLLSSNCFPPGNIYFISSIIISLNTTTQKPHRFQAKGISYFHHYQWKNSVITHCVKKCNADYLTFKSDNNCQCCKRHFLKINQKWNRVRHLDQTLNMYFQFYYPILTVSNQ